MAAGDTIHGTLVARVGAGVLLRGPSGAGKSDLALRLIEAADDWQLVSDDQVALTRRGVQLFGRAPASIAGKLEVRGVGIIEVSAAAEAEIRLIVDLVARKDVPRFPEDGEQDSLAGVALPRRRLHAFDASAPAKIALLLAQVLVAHRA